MEHEERARYGERLNAVRKELKAWEREFAAANGGKKAGRDDIKANPSIAQKYKDYNKLRDILSGKIKPSAPSSPRSTSSTRKRKSDVDLPAQTPTKKQNLLRTPSKAELHPAEIDPYDSPSVIRNLFSPKQVLGPTPQKDGQVLGLFDLLQDDSPSKPTPAAGGTNALRPSTSLSSATPRKAKFTEQGLDDSPIGRTPTSKRKRSFDSFTTPLKKREANDLPGTPSSVSKLSFATPSFLRRDSQRVSMPTIDENGKDLMLSPGVRKPKRPLVRGLSTILAGLRKMEDESHDDDWEALQEMENEAAGVTTETKSVSITARLLSGFDDESLLDGEVDEEETPAVGADGQPLRVWKKKGQKRTTRRVNLKPVLNKPKAAGEAEEDVDEGDEDGDDEDTQVVAETQLHGEDGDSDPDDPEFTAGDVRSKASKTLQTDKTKEKEKTGAMAAVKKKAVSALAHANFKRLKLRNSGAKGGPGFNSRFRRRR